MRKQIQKVVSKCSHLLMDERNQLYHVLKAYEGLFDSTLGR